MKKLIRKHVKLKAKNDSTLTYNYNYSIMQLLYKSLELIDKESSNLLHSNENYKIDGKVFKLFNFGLLLINPSRDKITSEGIKINKNDCFDLILSGVEDIIKDIIKGLILMDSIQIFESKFSVEEVTNDNRIRYFKNSSLYKARSAVIESIYDNGPKYLEVNSNRYYAALAQNLKRKYELVYGEPYTGELFFDIEDALSIKPKTIRGIHNKPENIKKGFIFNIWIKADFKMQMIAYYLGLGQSNSLGAGFLTYITGFN